MSGFEVKGRPVRRVEQFRITADEALAPIRLARGEVGTVVKIERAPLSTDFLVWAEVWNPRTPGRAREDCTGFVLATFATGEDIPHGANYIDTHAVHGDRISVTLHFYQLAA